MKSLLAEASLACRLRQHARRKNIYINYTRNEKAAKHEIGAKTQLDTNPC